MTQIDSFISRSGARSILACNDFFIKWKLGGTLSSLKFNWNSLAAIPKMGQKLVNGFKDWRDFIIMTWHRPGEDENVKSCSVASLNFEERKESRELCNWQRHFSSSSNLLPFLCSSLHASLLNTLSCVKLKTKNEKLSPQGFVVLVALEERAKKA